MSPLLTTKQAFLAFLTLFRLFPGESRKSHRIMEVCNLLILHILSNYSNYSIYKYKYNNRSICIKPGLPQCWPWLNLQNYQKSRISRNNLDNRILTPESKLERSWISWNSGENQLLTPGKNPQNWDFGSAEVGIA